MEGDGVNQWMEADIFLSESLPFEYLYFEIVFVPAAPRYNKTLSVASEYKN